ncbi:MAG: glutathione S-transferase family protein [Bdellovibrionota bacterium]
MKLYYSAGSCSTSCHISLEESGLKYEAIEVDWENASDPNVALVTKLNPMGTLPVAVLGPDQVLSQNIAIHTHIADQVPERGLLPKVGSFERAEAMHWLSFVASDLHKAYSPLFGLKLISNDPKAQAEVRKWGESNLHECFAYLDKRLSGRDYILGKNFSVVDSYCFVVSGWAKWLEIPTASYPNLGQYLKRVSERPAVQKVLKEEGLLSG